ncbi:MAG TPA: hypothetical protein VHX38_05405 [Pseudonocardiaceae bacterium]|jgi:hypothetical protein|nr:hypothetical protein [Pseudonocardiaceae bacterium]
MRAQVSASRPGGEHGHADRGLGTRGEHGRVAEDVGAQLVPCGVA